MVLAKQLSAIPNVESNAGWSRTDQESGIEILLPREGAELRTASISLQAPSPR
jgi:hypothetical protein